MKVRRPSIALIASIAVHVVVAAFFVQALVLEHPLFDVFGRDLRFKVQKPEQVGYVSLGDGTGQGARPAGAPPPAQHPVTKPPRPAPIPKLTAPTSIPTTVPTPAKPETAQPSANGTGNGNEPTTGGGGNLLGTQPRYTDPRLWGDPGAAVRSAPVKPGPPKTAAEKLDSVIADLIHAHNDSLQIANGNPRKPGDWTFNHNGQKYGIDQKFIHLGPLSIPTAVLALLPLNITANPTVNDHERQVDQIHDDIMRQAQNDINDADFQKAVREIRARKDRERREKADADKKQAAQNPDQTPAASGTSGAQ